MTSSIRPSFHQALKRNQDRDRRLRTLRDSLPAKVNETDSPIMVPADDIRARITEILLGSPLPHLGGATPEENAAMDADVERQIKEAEGSI